MTSAPEPRLCLGCGTAVPDQATPHCIGFGYLAHPELESLGIAHVDCDAFFAGVEKRDRPELRHVPVAVGGGDRGVVAAACYIARSFGVRSAMPSFKAKQLCPDLVFVKSNFAAYREASQHVRAMMDDLTPLVQQVSIDEAYLDLSGTERLHGRSAAASLIRMQRKIEREVGVTVSVGLSHNKALAKMASELKKPRGFAVIGKEETLRFLAPLPVDSIQGVGKSLAAKLAHHGVQTIGDLQKISMRDLVDRYGEAGLRLHHRAMGHDPRPVKVDRETKSISGETTFAKDLTSAADLDDRLYAMAQKVSIRAKAKGYAGLVITLKLKTKTFRTRTRRKTLGIATNLAEVIFEVGQSLLREELSAHSRDAYRLIGIGISDLVSAEDVHLDLAYPEKHERLRHKEDAIGALRARFGEGVIGTMRDRRIKTK
ncbi:MAG: DNA polymerase IV [Pseudomonadota bacterium]